MKQRQRKRAHMHNQRTQALQLGRWRYYQHRRVWQRIEGAVAQGGNPQMAQYAMLKDIQQIFGMNATSIIVDELE